MNSYPMFESDLNALKDTPKFKSKLFGISQIQRYLKVHYNRAARLVDVAIERGILVRDTEQQHLLRFKYKNCLRCEKEYEIQDPDFCSGCVKILEI